MAPEVGAAIIAAAVALVTTVATLWVQVLRERTATRRADAREAATKAEAADRVLAAYRDPLLRAAFDLQSRLYNITVGNFLVFCRRGTPREQEYCVENTVYVLAEFLGWLEIIRQEIQYLNVGDTEAVRYTQGLLDRIREVLRDDSSQFDARFRLFAGQQRAIGELMMKAVTPDHGERPRRNDCIGYARFLTTVRSDPEFSSWFDAIRDDIKALAAAPAQRSHRLVALQHALVAFLDASKVQPYFIRGEAPRPIPLESADSSPERVSSDAHSAAERSTVAQLAVDLQALADYIGVYVRWIRPVCVLQFYLVANSGLIDAVLEGRGVDSVDSAYNSMLDAGDADEIFSPNGVDALLAWARSPRPAAAPIVYSGQLLQLRVVVLGDNSPLSTALPEIKLHPIDTLLSEEMRRDHRAPNMSQTIEEVRAKRASR